MNRGEMITRVRDYILDEDTTNPRVSREKIERRLNEDARAIARILDRQGKIHYSKGTETFTSVAQTLSYELVATDIRRIYGLWQLDSSGNRLVKGRQIAENEVDSWTCAFDGTNWLYFVTRATDDGLFSINFPVAPNTVDVFSVDYYATFSDIATGSGNDSSSYTIIPTDWHELVVARSARIILGPDSSHYGAALAYEKELQQDMMMDVAVGDSPRQIAQEW